MILALLLTAMVFFGLKAYIQAKAYEEATTSLVSHMSAKKLAELSSSNLKKDNISVSAML